MSLISFNCECDNPTSRLDIRFTAACDNACPFCVEKNGRAPQPMATPQEMAEQTIAANPESVGILGGEPLLHPKRVLEYIKLIRPHIPKIYITTSLPFTILGNRDTVNQIIDLVDGFNVSLLAPTSQKHNELLRAKSRHNRFTLLKDLAAQAPHKFRACINLYKGGIDTFFKLSAMLDLAAECGITQIKINEIQWDDQGYISYKELMGELTPRMAPAYAAGCYKELPPQDHMRKFWPNLNIKLHRSCWKTTKAIKPTFRDILKDIIRIFFPPARKPFRVLYEDAKLCNGWTK